VWISIDIGKAAHHAAAIDNFGRQLWSVRVHNDQHSIEQLLSKAESVSTTRRWAVDLAGHTVTVEIDRTHRPGAEAEADRVARQDDRVVIAAPAAVSSPTAAICARCSAWSSGCSSWKG
jgi:hypothetical protein